MRKTFITVFAILFIANCQLLADQRVPSVGDESLSDIIIYYPLNDSHSRSWAQMAPNMTVGITYFQRYEDDYYDGNLLYKSLYLDGSENVDTVTAGTRLEKSVLLFDALSQPHIFVARSDNYDQIIDHYFKAANQWQSETIWHFHNQGGRFIYELSADTGPDHSFHLLVLKTRSNVDSDDFMDAWINSYLYHLTDESGQWALELIRNYNMAYTYDMHVKSSGRQDIKVDDDGYVHVTFSEQIYASPHPSRLHYATNKTGAWVVETALSYDPGSTDDAGWYPSLCLDTGGVPYIACAYVDRVPTYSATYSWLLLLERVGLNNWQHEIIAKYDDGYHGSDGRDYTGGLSHLIFDSNNTPHIIFSDIASSHWGYQRLCVGNIRYGFREEGNWKFATIYRQPSPTAYLNAAEMYGMCLFRLEETGAIRVIGQELKTTGEYEYTCDLVDIIWRGDQVDAGEDHTNSLPDQSRLSQNYPNPFNPGTSIDFELSRRARVTISIYNILGRQVSTLVDTELPAGHHSIEWNGTDQQGETVSTGTYFYRFQAGDDVETRKMLMLK